VIDHLFEESRRAGRGNSRPDLEISDFVKERHSLEARWARLSYLLSWVEQSSSVPSLRRCLSNETLRSSSLQHAYEHLQAQVGLRKKGQLPDTEQDELSMRVNTALRRTYRLITCFLYLSCGSDATIDERLEDMGYPTLSGPDFVITWNEAILVAASVAVSVVAGSAAALVVARLLEVRPPELPLGQLLAYSVPFVTIPILLVLLTKKVFSSLCSAWPVVSRNRPYERVADRPWHIYVLVSLMAAVVGFLVLFGMLEGARWLGVGTAKGDLLKKSVAWSFMILPIALLAAYHLDSVQAANVPWPLRSLRRGTSLLLYGLVSMAVTYFIFLYVNGLTWATLYIDDEALRGQAIAFCLTGLFLGISLNYAYGFLISTQQQRAERRRFRQYDVSIVVDRDNAVAAQILNVSDTGAFIKCDACAPDTGKDVTVTDSANNTAHGEIVRVAGDSFGVRFTDPAAWSIVQTGIEATAHSG
jgi:hypothetical protein